MAKHWRIVADADIPYAEAAFGPLGELDLLPGPEITTDRLRQADALIVRATTRVDARLLAGTKVQFVGTASIGTDHVDMDWLRQAGIAFAHAPGCNADAVAEYITCAVLELLTQRKGGTPAQSIAIIGAGHIGSRVARIAGALGLRVLLHDPPLQARGADMDFAPLAEALQADIVTLHVPLTRTGPHATFHLLGEHQLAQMRPRAMLLNSSRGAVVDNRALLAHLRERPHFQTALDVWEHEPDFSPELLGMVTLGTPHIAGYSLEGKVNATRLIAEALCRYFDVPCTWRPALPPAPALRLAGVTAGDHLQRLHQVLAQHYPIRADDAALRSLLTLPAAARPTAFEALRRNYRLRREFCNYTLRLSDYPQSLHAVLAALRFRFEP